MRGSLVLCDYASQDQLAGKVNLMGAGWSMIGPQIGPHAVVAFIKVGWTEANRPHKLALRLADSDGAPVKVPGPAGEQQIQFSGNLEVGRPPGLPEGSEIDATFAINLLPLPLVPGQRYEWLLEVDDKVLASEGFLVRRLPQQSAQPPPFVPPEPGTPGPPA